MVKQWLVSGEVNVSAVNDTLYLKLMDQECTKLAMLYLFMLEARKMVSLEPSAVSYVYMFAPYSQDVPICSEFQMCSILRLSTV